MPRFFSIHNSIRIPSTPFVNLRSQFKGLANNFRFPSIRHFQEIQNKTFSTLSTIQKETRQFKIIKMAADMNMIEPKNRQEWRDWLEKNHETQDKVWVVYYKKASGKETIKYEEVVEECLCFGWIDSTAKSIDEEKWKQMITRRKPKGVWSALNKKRVASMIDQGLMTDAGLETIKRAKQNGSWVALDAAEALTVPDDLKQALEANKTAEKHFEAFSNSSKKYILSWIYNAKRAETRSKRIEETVRLAEQNLKSVGQNKAK